ncbi:CDP-glycerol glycerophosphotransferase family protein [Mangrovimonas sp. YM274]|uniref:CDP-glycerol glycerophosphotransferase family protein n=1 Tax=Mangrovimonas sp. YM274 TaxID=3070660 RepID=UPI0027DCB459|nr:CDP-glycerol glycerophosphotransferase family protein [Mangrovimonas sp. YM274]WMI67838.1 CDP-glycerol glycerophosphotransferase family protein [Mangrovimonas sp. YM274]
MTYNFLIYISYSYALPIGNPLEQEIISQGHTVKWFSDLTDGKNALLDKENHLLTIEEVVNYKPDIVLAATDNVPDFITGLKVQIFHGFFAQKRPEGNNKFAHFRIRGFFDLYCTQGPTSTKGFLEKQKKHPHFEVIETGWSKVDPLFPIEKRERSSGDKPTIMIASTFTERLSLAHRNDVYLKIQELSETGNYQFYMVLHPKLPQDIKLKWQKLVGENFVYYNTTDLIPIFKKSDILFADTTSAIQEFLLQGKPVVTFNHTFDHDYLINIKDANSIDSGFQNALTYPPSLIENISKFINQLHPYFDGQSSKRVVDATIEFLQRDKHYLKNKPLNLIRKYKLRKQLNYFTFKSYNKPYTLPKN